MAEGRTVGEWLKELAKSSTSSEEDGVKMSNLLHLAGFPKAIVVCGIVYLEGKGTLEAPPTSINSIAEMLVAKL